MFKKESKGGALYLGMGQRKSLDEGKLKSGSREGVDESSLVAIRRKGQVAYRFPSGLREAWCEAWWDELAYCIVNLIQSALDT